MLDELNEKEKDEVENILIEFEVMFIKLDGKLCYIGLVEYNINIRYGNLIELFFCRFFK